MLHGEVVVVLHGGAVFDILRGERLDGSGGKIGGVPLADALEQLGIEVGAVGAGYRGAVARGVEVEVHTPVGEHLLQGKSD